MRKQDVLLIPLFIAAVSWLGCGPEPQQPVRYVPNSYAGVYQGAHELHFNITSPVVQSMSPDRHNGPIHVNDGNMVELHLRLYEDDHPCHLTASRHSAGRVVVNQGQRCMLRFHYQGQLVHAVMDIHQGVGDFSNNGLQVELTGPFTARTVLSGQSGPMSGNAVIRFSGRR